MLHIAHHRLRLWQPEDPALDWILGHFTGMVKDETITTRRQTLEHKVQSSHDRTDSSSQTFFFTMTAVIIMLRYLIRVIPVLALTIRLSMVTPAPAYLLAANDTLAHNQEGLVRRTDQHSISGLCMYFLLMSYQRHLLTNCTRVSTSAAAAAATAAAGKTGRNRP
jgi:hypothetical protein